MIYFEMFKYSVNIPISRFRRELNSWMRFIGKYPENTIFITRNNKVVSVAISLLEYEKLNTALKKEIV